MTMNVLETAKAALAVGFFPVLVQSGGKKPQHNNWETREYTSDMLAEDFSWEHAAIGLRWGQGHCDVDLETPLVASIGAVLLPPTPMIWGHLGSDKLHRVYACTPKNKTTKIRRANKEVLAEVRGEKGQSVIPPSPWLDTKGTKVVQGLYGWLDPAWDFSVPIPEIDVRELEVQVKEVVFAAVMAEMWPTMDGSRHDAMIGIAGMLLKGGRDADRVALICRCITEFGHDGDPGDRLQIAKTTASRLANGEEVAGYSMLEAALGPETAKWAAGLFHLPAEKVSSVGGQTLNDVGNAELFVKLFGNDVMYLRIKKDWAGYDGRRWDIESGSFIEQAKAKATVKHMEALAPTLKTATDRQAMRIHAIKSGSANAVGAMIRMARDVLSRNSAHLDVDPWLLNVLNGTLNLKTGELQPHRAEDYLTKLAGVEFDPKAECPQWKAYLEKTFRGDQKLINYIQRWSGYCLTGSAGEQKIQFCYGNGANGKTTYLEVMLGIMGEYGMKTPVETVMKTKVAPAISNEVARLRGARLVVTHEIQAEMRLAENVIKDLSGNDTKTARFLYGEPFDFKPVMKLIMYGNYKPIVTGTDDGIWRRLFLVPFKYTLSEDERIKDYDEILVREEGPGILNWCLEGCLRWQLTGLMVPDAVAEATEEYREEMDVFGEFFGDYLVKGSGEKILMQHVYSGLYQPWCMETGEREMTKRRLIQKLVELGGEKYKSNGNWYLRGIGEAKGARVL